MRASRAIRFGILVVAVAGGVVLFVRALESRMVYFPTRPLMGSPRDAGLSFDDVRLATEDGLTLHAWHVRSPEPVGLVVHFHGNAGNISGRIPYAAAFATERLETLLVDYRGYGRSQGEPSEEGLYRDADAAYRWAADRGLPLVVYGESLGGAVAIDLCARRRVALLVAQSTFTRLSEMANLVIPFSGALISQRFDSLDKIRRVSSPILFVHGDADDVVPYAMGRRLHEAARSQKSFFTVRGAHHNDMVDLAGSEIARRTRSLLGS